MSCLTPVLILARSLMLQAAAILVSAYWLLALPKSAAAAAALPTAIAQLQSFRGSIAYQSHPAAQPDRETSGRLSVSAEGWVLEEQGPAGLFHLSNADCWVRTSQVLHFDDPLAVEGLSNSWAVLLGDAAGADAAGDRNGSSWLIGSTRVYVDPDSNRVSGAVDEISGSGVSFSYADWTSVDGLWLPQRITRLYLGLVTAEFIVDRYSVGWAPSTMAQVLPVPRQPPAAPATPNPKASLDTAAAWRSYVMLFVLLFLAFGAMAWTRRDALTQKTRRKLARDVRAWRDQGTTVFVSPEGLLHFGGRTYRVGAAFFNRRVLVQASALFVRVSAADLSTAVVLARKFPYPARTRRQSAKMGFTLIETLVATALFAAVVVAAVFPALLVLAQSDRVAAEHEAAATVAANALADEEAALEYGTGISPDSSSSVIEGMTVDVNVSKAGTDLYQVSVSASDAGGSRLASIATLVGPPVPAPSSPESPAP